MRILLLVFLLTQLSQTSHAGDGHDESSFLHQTVYKFGQLSEKARLLNDSAIQSCNPKNLDLQKNFHDLFDDWIALSHLQFGPMEMGTLRFEIGFWPDPRSKTQKAVNKVLVNSDFLLLQPKKFAKISVAARGLYALEHTLFAKNFKSQDLAPFRCKLIQAITRDLTRTTEILFSNWQDFAQENKQIDLTRDYFKSLVSGLEMSANHRLSVPLGTIEKPRPKLAEVWRSGRTTRHIGQSIVSLHELSNYLSSAQPNIMNELNYWFLKAKNQAGALNDPILFGVSDPVKRLEIEALRATMQTILFLSQSRLGPALGVSAGFNSGDGD